MQRGRIVKLLGGFYTVDVENQRYETRARGNFRKKGIKPLVGDFVKFDQAYILEVEPRVNQLKRPPVANVDCAIVVMSTVSPDFSFNLLDRFLLFLEHHQISASIYLTKLDRVSDESFYKQIQSNYQAIGYSVKYDSADLVADFKDKVTVFMGQTGVGKSTLLNLIAPELQLATGATSEKLGRGRHTTRHVELYPVANGWVADTPGFSSLDYMASTAPELNRGFVEIYDRSADCKFRECTHTHEPECAVKQAVKKGEILESRYASYLQILSEIQKNRETYAKTHKSAEN